MSRYCIEEREDSIETNFKAMTRYASTLGVTLDEDSNLIYYEGFLAITKSLNGNDWLIIHDGESYCLLHKSKHFKKQRYHEQYKSKSFHVIIKSMISTHGIEYYKGVK